MSNDAADPPDAAPDTYDDVDREAILARRRRLIATALSGLALTSCAASTSGADSGDGARIEASVEADAWPQPCLSAVLDAGDASRDTGAPSDATDVPGDQSKPMPCLDPAFDGG